MSKQTTHTGTVEYYSYGRPWSQTVALYETARYWVSVNKHGHTTKYRKSDGRRAGATVWDQVSLNIDNVKENDK